jgi:hypothetical protein
MTIDVGIILTAGLTLLLLLAGLRSIGTFLRWRRQVEAMQRRDGRP